MTNALALSREISTQCSNGAAMRAIGAVLSRQVTGDEVLEFAVAVVLLEAAFQRTRYRGGRKVVLRFEVTVKSPVCETDSVHDRVDANAVEPMLTKQP